MLDFLVSLNVEVTKGCAPNVLIIRCPIYLSRQVYIGPSKKQYSDIRTLNKFDYRFISLGLLFLEKMMILGFSRYLQETLMEPQLGTESVATPMQPLPHTHMHVYTYIHTHSHTSLNHTVISDSMLQGRSSNVNSVNIYS